MKMVIKFLGFIVSAVAQIAMVSLWYEVLGMWASKLSGSIKRMTGDARRHWADFVIPAAHVLAIALLVITSFKVHWVQGTAALATLGVIYGYSYWPSIKGMAVKAYTRVMRAFGKKVAVKIQTPGGPVVDVEFRLIGQEA